MQLMLVCEDEGHVRVGTGVLDRVLRDHDLVPPWFREQMADVPHAARSWLPDGERKYFSLHGLHETCRKHQVRLLPGRFNGERGAAGAQMARNALLLARRFQANGDAVDAVVVIWDMDGDGEARRTGLVQAKREATALGGFRVVLGCPDREGEAWMISGFEAENSAERAALDQERATLSFCPVAESHRLQEAEDGKPRSPKRVWRALTRGDAERQERCWTEPSLEVLRARGQENGLADYLDEIERELLPLLTSADAR
jgi:hypothetical protein